MADSRTSSADMKALWTDILSLLPALKSSTQLGKATPASFSVKLQRKLASTVPPRPIVQVSDEAAFDHLERLCRDGSAVVEVLDYHDSHSLIVSLILSFSAAADMNGDVCLSLSSTETTTVSVRAHIAAALPLR
jgi:hypothetical protein